MKELHSQIEIDAPAERVWYLLMPGLFDGEHSLEIQPLGENRTRFVQRETFRGLLVPLSARGLLENTRRGFEEMNRALKERAETPPGA